MNGSPLSQFLQTLHLFTCSDPVTQFPVTHRVANMKFRRTLCLIVIVSLVKTSRSQDNTAIDFSGGEVDLETGAVCVQVEEEREAVEQDTEQQCTQQIVRQGELERTQEEISTFHPVLNWHLTV